MAFTTKLPVFGWLKEGFHTCSYCLGIMTTERDPFPLITTKFPMVAVTPEMGNTDLCDQTSRQNIWDFLSIAYSINLNARDVLPSCRQSMCATQLFGQRFYFFCRQDPWKVVQTPTPRRLSPCLSPSLCPCPCLSSRSLTSHAPSIPTSPMCSLLPIYSEMTDD